MSFFNLGITMLNSSNSEGAIEAFKQSIAADPNYSESYYELGRLLIAKDATMAEGIQMLKKYLQIGKKQDQKDISKALIDALEKK